MDNRQKELSCYRIQESKNSLKVAEHCLKEGLYKDSINRSYYAAFYAIKAVLALGTVDFKRHKDVFAAFLRFGENALLSGIAAGKNMGFKNCEKCEKICIFH